LDSIPRALLFRLWHDMGRLSVATTGWSLAAALVQLSVAGLGQKQTLEHASAMSALPPKADIGLRALNVR